MELFTDQAIKGVVCQLEKICLLGPVYCLERAHSSYVCPIMALSVDVMYDFFCYGYTYVSI